VRESLRAAGQNANDVGAVPIEVAGASRRRDQCWRTVQRRHFAGSPTGSVVCKMGADGLAPGGTGRTS